MTIIEAIKSGETFRMTYPIDNTYGNVGWIGPDFIIKIRMRDGNWFSFDSKTFASTECHLYKDEKKIEITEEQLEKAWKAATDTAYKPFKAIAREQLRIGPDLEEVKKELGFCDPKPSNDKYDSYVESDSPPDLEC